MVSLTFHPFVIGTVIFALCSYECSCPLHSFVVDSSLLDCCDLMVFFVCVFSTLCLQVGSRLGF